jgi:hypothetical protein
MRIEAGDGGVQPLMLAGEQGVMAANLADAIDFVVLQLVRERKQRVLAHANDVLQRAA